MSGMPAGSQVRKTTASQVKTVPPEDLVVVTNLAFLRNHIPARQRSNVVLQRHLDPEGDDVPSAMFVILPRTSIFRSV
jgi:hypothetical protein